MCALANSNRRTNANTQINRTPIKFLRVVIDIIVIIVTYVETNDVYDKAGLILSLVYTAKHVLVAYVIPKMCRFDLKDNLER